MDIIFGDIGFFLRGFLVGLAISIPLGPIGVMIVQRTLTRGNFAGFFSGVGAAVSDLLYALIAGFGFTLVIDFIDHHRIWLQVIGGAIFLVFGVYTFMQNPIRQIRQPRKGNTNYWQDVFTTFFLTASNPLAVFSFIVIFTSFDVFSQIHEKHSMFAVLAGVFLGAITWWMFLTLLVGLFRRFINIRHLWWINKISGVAIALIATGIIVYVFV